MDHQNPWPTQPASAGKLFAKRLFGANSALGGGAGIVVGMVLSHLQGDVPVPGWVLGLVGGILFVLMSALALALIDASDEAKEAFARLGGSRVVVVAAREPYAPHVDSCCVLIVEWSGAARVPMGGAVVVSVAEDEVERPLGFGTVRDQQSDGRLVITIDRPHEGVEDYIKRILEPDGSAALLPKVRVGGTIPSGYPYGGHESTNPATVDGGSGPATSERDSDEGQ